MMAISTKSSVILVLLASAVATARTKTTTADRTDQPQRVLHNSETGTITHPLIPHTAHLERRRRELQRSNSDATNGVSAKTRTIPRAYHHASPSADHSESPRLLRASNVGGDGHADHRLQQQMGALYQGYGTHYVDLWVGTPTPQRQTVIVDTGSSNTAFPCSGCKDCGSDYHTDKYFVEANSDTFRALKCGECYAGLCDTSDEKKECLLGMAYAEGSAWYAYEGMDVCHAGGPFDLQDDPNGRSLAMDGKYPVEMPKFAFELAFGCQETITGLFISQLADGIMGMQNDQKSFWKQMHTSGTIPRPEFSLCFSRHSDTDPSGTGAGAMTLGGTDPRLHTSPMVFADNINKRGGFYYVHVKSVYIREGGGMSAQVTPDQKLHKLNVNVRAAGNVIIDSGTTSTYLAPSLTIGFKKAWKAIVGRDYNHDYISLTEEEIAKLPTILLVLQGHRGGVGDEPEGNPDEIPGYVGSNGVLSGQATDVVVALPASHYMEFDADEGMYKPCLYVDESPQSILGANTIMGHDVYFDVGRGRVGWAESDCDYYGLDAI